MQILLPITIKTNKRNLGKAQVKCKKKKTRKVQRKINNYKYKLSNMD